MASRWQTGCLVLLGLGVASAAVAAWAFWPAPPPHYDTVAVDKGHITASVSATGTLSALVTVQVGAQVSGRVDHLYADFNSEVVKDQPIARLDPELYEAALEQARANDASAKANLDRAQVQAEQAAHEADRAKSLASQHLISDQDEEAAATASRAAVASVHAAQASVQQAMASLHQAQVNLDYTTITSPVNGTVISRSVDVGQTVAASLSAPTLFIIAEDLSKMQVDTSVAEADIARLSKDMPASFTVDAWSGRTFDGKVRQIRNAPQTVQNVVSYDAVVDVDNTDLALRPGMTANVTFTYDQKDGVLRIPNVALLFHPPGAKPSHSDGGSKQRTLYLLKDGAPVPVAVETGLTDGTMTAILSGDVKEGDLVVTDMSAGGDGKSTTSNPFRRGL